MTNGKTDNEAGFGRRTRNRRVADIPIAYADRRRGDRRSGHDRRQARRHVAR